ncbi:MAG: glyoxalase [Actinomycetota bacterium]
MTAVVALEVVSPVEPWQAIGLHIVDGRTTVGGIELRFRSPVGDEAVRIDRWVLADCPQAVTDIDGLATVHADTLPPARAIEHPLGAARFDHLVVMTSSLDRTCGAITAATGEPLKRIREAGPIRQGFHRLGGLIIEVVESERVTAPTASFWGFVLIVDDLDAVYARLGDDLVSAPKAAVQPGRMIASFRGAAGLGLPIALMTP